MEELVDITNAEVVEDYRLRLTFADGSVGDVDFGDRDWRGVFEPLADPAEFARVEVDAEAGTIRSGRAVSTWRRNRSMPRLDDISFSLRVPAAERTRSREGSRSFDQVDPAGLEPAQ
ncbi:MAG: DUF2442 domain-containing protein [Gaiellaceae bacterium]